MPEFSTDSDLSEALKEAYASAPSDVVILHTLEVRHPSFVDDEGAPTALRVVRDSTSLNAKLEDTAAMNPGEYVEFQQLFFDITLPGETDDNTAPEIEVTVVNVGRVMMQYLDAAVGSVAPIELTYRPYLSTDLSGPHMDPPITLIVRSVSAGVDSVTIRASYGDTPNKKFPGMDYTTVEYPGLAAR